MYLPDINLWLALTFEAHVHHRCAAGWFDRVAPKSCYFCRFTQQGFLRLATNKSIFKDEALTMSKAWACYDKLLQDERVDFSDEPHGIESSWRKFTRKEKYSHRVWSDAYLAAFAETAHLGIVTFDKGFNAYSGLRVNVLGS